jgi:hypothetical protein
LEDVGVTAKRIVEVVVTVGVPMGTDVAAVTETVASWSAPLDAAVGWRVVTVEAIEPCDLGEGRGEGAATTERVSMTSAWTCIWCSDDVPEFRDVCDACIELVENQWEEARRGVQRSEEELRAELMARRNRG